MLLESLNIPLRETVLERKINILNLLIFKTISDGKQSPITIGYKVAHMGERPNLEAIPDDAPKEVVDIMIKCWDAEKTKRPLFQGNTRATTAMHELLCKVCRNRIDTRF